ncbi:MAG: hypothetical protein K6F06_09890 [Bacteroidales bacterium]|nr:hypothetical protein [Bacteroidales bacterium]
MMRITNRILLGIVSALSILILLSSCSLDEDFAGDGTYKVEVTAFKGSGESDMTRALELTGDDGDFLGAPWEAGDIVTVYQVIPTATSSADMYREVGTLTAQSGGYTTTLKGTLKGSFIPGVKLMLSYRHGLLFDYTGQNGSLDDIASNHDYALAYVDVSDVGSGTLVFENTPVFESLQSIFRLTFKDADGNYLEAEKISIRCYTNLGNTDNLIQYYNPSRVGLSYTNKYSRGSIEVTLDSPSHTAYVALAGLGESGPMTGLVESELYISVYVGASSYSYHKETFTFENNKYYLLDLIMHY